MEWQLILVELIWALLVLGVGGFCVVGLIWFWGLMNGDLMEHYRQVNQSRKKWRGRE